MFAMPDETESDSRVAAKMYVKARLFFLALGLILGIAVIQDAWSKLNQPPPEYGDVPAFSLQNQADQSFGSNDLMGKVWVANFIFTRCKTICPVFSKSMADLQNETVQETDAADLQLVSFSVDPAFDTPQVLAEYSRRYDAKPGYWHFLTGPTDSVKDVVISGLKMHMGDADKVETPDALMHGSHFVLVGPKMKIRGYYPVDNDQTITQILRDIRKLMPETQ